MKEISPATPPSDPRGDERTLRLEIALRRSEKLAMAGRLAASVMHEINNPSQAIADLVYLLGKEADHPELVRIRAAQIEEQLVRIQYIARQTLSFFRDTPQIQSRDLVPLVDGVALPLCFVAGEADPGAERAAGYADRLGLSRGLSSAGFQPGAQCRRGPSRRRDAPPPPAGVGDQWPFDGRGQRARYSATHQGAAV
jgi:signal transduction histidine kinase